MMPYKVYSAYSSKTEKSICPRVLLNRYRAVDAVEVNWLLLSLSDLEVGGEEDIDLKVL